MQAKYIIIDGVSPLLFSTTVTHKDATRAAHGKPITGAGFCSVEDKTDGLDVRVWGKSVSLGDMAAKPEDAALIAHAFNPERF